MFSANDYFDLKECPFPAIYNGLEYVWEAIPKIKDVLSENLKPDIHSSVRISPHTFIGENVQIGANTVIQHGAVILGPAIIGSDCEIRTGAYLRPDVIMGNGVIMGNSCEFKNCFLHNEANVPHFAYIGDSILGYRAHLGAGVKISNVKLIYETVKVKSPEGVIDTGLIKFGAILGDKTDIGCNSVLNPGSMIGPESIVYPNSSWRGILPAKNIVKLRQTFEVVQRKG